MAALSSDEVERWFPSPVPVGPARRPERPDDGEPVRFNWFGQDRRARAGRQPFDPRSFTHLFAAGIVGLGLVLVGLALIVQPVVLHFAAPAPATDGFTVTDAAVRGQLLESAVLLIGVPLAWTLTMYGPGLQAVGIRLALRSKWPGRDLFLGLAAGVVALVGTVFVMFVLSKLVELPRNEVVEALGGVLSWQTVFLVALVSSTTEELFFRGFLQARIGIVPTNVLFGFAHLSYGIPMQVVLPMGLGFLFSYLTVRTRSILPATVAHFVYNLTQLSLAKWVIDSGLAP